MASQALSGFSTEATQYGKSSSYYLLDNVPGAGSVIEGPVTVTNNLTVTGSQIVQNSLGVLGNLTAAGLAPPAGSTAPLAIVGSTATTGGVKVSVPAGATGQVSVEGGGTNFLGLPANGNINLITGAVPGTVADRITISNAGVGTLTQLNGLDISGGDVTLNGGQGATGKVAIINEGNGGLGLTNSAGSLSIVNTGTGMFMQNNTINAPMTLLNTVGPIAILGDTNPGNSIRIGSGDSANGVFLQSGLSCEGSYAAPIAIVGGVYVMTTNKAWLSTTATVNIIALPGALANGNRGVALIQAQAGRMYAPLSATCDGNFINIGFAPGFNQFFTIVVF
jgi:hypothetical protein